MLTAYLILTLSTPHGPDETVTLAKEPLVECETQGEMQAAYWLSQSQDGVWKGYTLKAWKCSSRREGSA